jgi:small subunit ribosomal protein S13
MARIAGRYPKKERCYSTYLHLGLRSRAIEVLEKAPCKIKKVQDWNDDEIGAIREAVSVFKKRRITF